MSVFSTTSSVNCHNTSNKVLFTASSYPYQFSSYKLFWYITYDTQSTLGLIAVEEAEQRELLRPVKVGIQGTEAFGKGEERLRYGLRVQSRS